MYFLLLWELCVFLFFVMHDLVSILILHSSGRGIGSAFFASVVLQMYCYYKCPVILPYGAVG